MSNPNNSTELGGMKEIKVSESEKNFDIYFQVGCIVFDGDKVKGIEAEETGIKKYNSADSKSKVIGKAKSAELEKIKKAKTKAKQMRERQLNDEAR